MRRAVWLPALFLLCALPGRALADSHRAYSCGVRLQDDLAWASPHLQCTAGVAVRVSWNGMKVRPSQGNSLRVRFTDDTLFETDSGEGVLDGLVAGDYVCVTYVPHSGTVTAVLVLFDPDFPPCGPGRPLSFANPSGWQYPSRPFWLQSWRWGVFGRDFPARPHFAWLIHGFGSPPGVLVNGGAPGCERTRGGDKAPRYSNEEG